jgi:NPCBM/NEW2 domain-containing protein
MPTGRTVAALLLIASAGLRPAIAADLRPLQGDTVKGEVVSLNAREVVIHGDGKDVTTPVEQVLQIDFGSAPKPLPAKYIDVELADGSLLHCGQVVLRGKQVEADLVGGQKLQFPLDAVGYILNDAQDARWQRQWKELLGKKHNSDVLASVRDGEPVTLNGTFGNADAEGQTIAFDLNSQGRPRDIKVEKIHGLLFFRQPDPKAPPVLCKLSDTSADLVMVSDVAATPDGFTVTTPVGVKIDYPRALLVRLDFSKGKLTYLSDLDPAKVVYASTEDRPEPYRRDKNLDNGDLKLANADKAQGACPRGTVPKGLAVHAYTALEYDLGGDYREFTTWLGVDQDVGSAGGATKVEVQGDGKELFTGTVAPADAPVHVTCNVKDVRRLRIIVSSPDLLDLGRHVDLADAKVSK